MTTEHFTLQTARAVVNAEISARLQLYMTTLSSAIIALALVGQVSGALGRAFQAFALVLLPVVYFLGAATLARLLQAAAEWRTYGQGMSRIRHWYLEVAPEMAPYFVLPATDDPWASLAAVGIRRRNAWQGLLATAPWIVVVVNSVLAGVVAGLLARLAGATGPLLPAPTPSGSSAATWTPPRWPFRPRPNGSPDRPVSDRQKPAGSLVERDSR